MHRELYALLYTDNDDKPPMIPIMPSYSTAKANLSGKNVHPWKWVSFTIPSREDGAVFHHWRKIEEEEKEYKFSKFNKKLNIPVYTDEEYDILLRGDENWKKDETDHLFEMVKRFDRRWHVLYDRYDHDKFPRDTKRTLEELKERFFQVCNQIEKARSPAEENFKGFYFDAEHERRRKLQLERLFSRNKEQIRNEVVLIDEIKKITLKRKDRAKKTLEFHKLLSFDSNTDSSHRIERRKRKFPSSSYKLDFLYDKTGEKSYGIRFPDYRSSGVPILRSQMLKLPNSINQKKIKNIEQSLNDLKIMSNPICVENVIQLYNRLRSDIVYLNELRSAYYTYDTELKSLKSRYESPKTGLQLNIKANKTKNQSNKPTTKKSLDI